MNVYINPGSGPVANTSAHHAQNNMVQFIKDCTVPGLVYDRCPIGDVNGRYSFILSRTDGSNQIWEIDMPGLPIEEVRFMDFPGQNAWHFPRLYVDGGSWLWLFALINDDDLIENQSDTNYSMNLVQGMFAEMNRVREIIAIYQTTGPAGAFAIAMMQADIADAERLIAGGGNIIEMLQRYESLKSWTI